MKRAIDTLSQYWRPRCAVCKCPVVEVILREDLDSLFPRVIANAVCHGKFEVRRIVIQSLVLGAVSDRLVEELAQPFFQKEADAYWSLPGIKLLSE